jgi:hypothetical protein
MLPFDCTTDNSWAAKEFFEWWKDIHFLATEDMLSKLYL